MQRDESHRLPLLLLLDRVIPSVASLHLTDDEPGDTAAAAGCSPKAASAAGNVPRHTVYSRAQGAGADASQTRAARRPGPFVSSFAGVHTALGDKNRAQHPWRLARRLPLHSSSVPGVNWPGGAFEHGAAR